MEPSLDIIIPTFGRTDRIPALVEKLVRLKRQSDTVYVVYQDACAPQASLAECVFIHSFPPSLVLARNKGLESGNGDIILFLDDDIIPGKDLLEAHRRSYTEHSIGAVAGALEDPLFDKTVTIPSTYDDRTGECIQNFSVNESQETISVMGANMSFRRKTLEQIGGFDPFYTGNALWEDIDAAFRLRDAGYKIWFSAEARAIHLRDDRGGCRSDKGQKYLYHQFANTAYFACKFAPREHAGTWLTFWKYRLEFLTRKSRNAKNHFTHDPLLVLAGISGAATGVFRYICKIITHKISKIRS